VSRHVLITGGLGFIGSHVADAFLADGWRVTIVDSMITAVTDGAEFDVQPGCHVVRMPVEELLAMGAAPHAYDLVVHAASLVGPAGILAYAGRLGARIVRSTEAVLDACGAAGIPVCVFSSAEVYGRSGALAEEDDLLVPTAYNARIEYAVGKTLVEAMTVNRRHEGLRGIVIRPFNVAGPRQSEAGGFVMPTFVQQALAGAPLTVFAGGAQVRTFVAAADVARFLTRHLHAALAGPDPIVNLGNPENQTTVLGLAERVRTLLGSDSEIHFVDGKAIHGPRYEEAMSVVKQPVLGAATRLGWRPEIGLDALIESTADHYLQQSARAAEHAL